MAWARLALVLALLGGGPLLVWFAGQRPTDSPEDLARRVGPNGMGTTCRSLERSTAELEAALAAAADERERVETRVLLVASLACERLYLVRATVGAWDVQFIDRPVSSAWAARFAGHLRAPGATYEDGVAMFKAVEELDIRARLAIYLAYAGVRPESFMPPPPVYEPPNFLAINARHSLMHLTQLSASESAVWCEVVGPHVYRLLALSMAQRIVRRGVDPDELERSQPESASIHLALVISRADCDRERDPPIVATALRRTGSRPSASLVIHDTERAPERRERYLRALLDSLTCEERARLMTSTYSHDHIPILVEHGLLGPPDAPTVRTCADSWDARVVDEPAIAPDPGRAECRRLVYGDAAAASTSCSPPPDEACRVRPIREPECQQYVGTVGDCLVGWMRLARHRPVVPQAPAENGHDDTE